MKTGFAARRAMLRAWAAHDAAAFRAFTAAIESRVGRPFQELRVLDLGCGPNAPMTVLLHAAGSQVTGVDVSIEHRWGLGFRPSRYVEYAGRAGVLRSVRKLAGELAFDRLYFRHLAHLTGLALSDKGLDLQAMDIQRPTLAPATFDVVHSNATWEHLEDVALANRTLASVLRPGGVGYIEIHLFPSLSGGHDLPWIVPGVTMLNGHEPWRHLRDPVWNPPVFLNRLREQDYRTLFERTEGLEIEDWSVEFTEGSELVTAALLNELTDYSIRELTTRSIVAVVRRPD